MPKNEKQKGTFSFFPCQIQIEVFAAVADGRHIGISVDPRINFSSPHPPSLLRLLRGCFCLEIAFPALEWEIIQSEVLENRV